MDEPFLPALACRWPARYSGFGSLVDRFTVDLGQPEGNRLRRDELVLVRLWGEANRPSAERLQVVRV